MRTRTFNISLPNQLVKALDRRAREESLHAAKCFAPPRWPTLNGGSSGGIYGTMDAGRPDASICVLATLSV